MTARKIVGTQIVGCGFCVVQGGNVGLFDIVVHKDFRQRGIATEIVGSLLGKARDMGTETGYLQVVANNEPARHLYARFGFREKYRYWYRIRQAGED